MKLSNAREAYYDFSKSLSDLNRKLDFAAIGLIWLFKQTDPKVTSRNIVPQALHLPIILIVFSLTADFLQYAWSTAAWGGYARLNEMQRNRKRKQGLEVFDDPELAAPDFLNRPSLLFFWGKAVCTVVAYIWILRFLLNTVW